jgi:hypothetical protein
MSQRRGRRAALDIWPGFVDVISSLLILILFLLMTSFWRSSSWAGAVGARRPRWSAWAASRRTGADALP